MARTDTASPVIAAPPEACLSLPSPTQDALTAWLPPGGMQRQLRAIRRPARRVVPDDLDLRRRLDRTRQVHRGLRHR